MNRRSTALALKRWLTRLLVVVSCFAVAFWFTRPTNPRSAAQGVKVFAISSHSAVLKPDGTLWAWKDNTLFFDTTPFLRFGLPTQIVKGSHWRAIATGWQAFVAIKQDGTMWVWGNGANGLWGDTTLQVSGTPTQVGTNTHWNAVAAGNDFFIGLKNDGGLWSWGGNRFGQLGDGTGGEKEHPGGEVAPGSGKKEPVRIGNDNDWTMVAARVFRATALKKDGSLWAWGWNVYGELGDGTYEIRNAPIRIGKDNDWVAVFTGNNHTLAIKRDGSLWVWGDNPEGQLGNGTKIKESAPIRVGSDTNWLAAAGGGYHTLAIKTDGSLWAWGSNDQGQLGDGTKVNRLKPVKIGHGKDWIAIAAGERHSIGLKRDGSVWEWGMIGPPPENKLKRWLRVNLGKIGIKLPAVVNLRPMKRLDAKPDNPTR